MSTSLLYGLLVGGLTSIHIPAFTGGDAQKRKAERGWWAIKFAFFSFAAALIHYVVLSTSSQAELVEVTVTLVAWLFWLNFVIRGGFAPFLVHISLLVAFLAASCSSLLPDRARYKASLIGHVERFSWSKTPPPLQLSSTPSVTCEQAVARGAKFIRENFGSRYELGYCSLQRVNDVLVWVAPLDVKSFKQWLLSDYAPAVIVVDASNANAPVRVIAADSQNSPVRLVFTPKAFLGKQLWRHINNEQGLFSLNVEGGHLELDDNLKPWWVVTGHIPGKRGQSEEGRRILLVDPETGAIQKFTPDKTPSWVDVTVTTWDITKKLKDWGTLSVGIGAALVGSPNLAEPASVYGQSVWFVVGSDGRSYYYAGLKQSGVRYERLLSFTLTDVKSGKTIEYPYEATNAGVTPQRALELAGKSFPSFEGAFISSPLLLSCDGKPVYYVTLLDADGALKKVALVDAERDLVAVGDDKESALREFHARLKTPDVATL